MVGMSKSGSRYGRRSNWFKIHCLMQANGNKRGMSNPTVPPQPPPPPALMNNSLGKLQCVTVKAPRQIIDVGVVRVADNNPTVRWDLQT